MKRILIWVGAILLVGGGLFFLYKHFNCSCSPGCTCGVSCKCNAEMYCGSDGCTCGLPE